MADARQVGALLVVTGAAPGLATSNCATSAATVAPAGSYQIHTDTSSGDVSNGLTNDPSGSHKIDASTSSGDIELAAGS
ncbi:MAG TPA: hypothetical protein VGD71_00960 [Kribbella sp.]|jgi:hypothetical protein